MENTFSFFSVFGFSFAGLPASNNFSLFPSVSTIVFFLFNNDQVQRNLRSPTPTTFS